MPQQSIASFIYIAPLIRAWLQHMEIFFVVIRFFCFFFRFFMKAFFSSRADQNLTTDGFWRQLGVLVIAINKNVTWIWFHLEVKLFTFCHHIRPQ